jgi:hypothetical protein
MPDETTDDEIRSIYIDKMCEDLGAQFYALWREVASLHRKWGEFVELFGTKPSRIELLNQAAPEFIQMVEDALFDDTVLHISRLTDNPVVGRKETLTIQNLPSLVAHPDAVQALVDTAKAKVKACRDHRNNRISHTNRDLALNRSATALADVDKKEVEEAIGAIAAVLNAVHVQYLHEDKGLCFDARPIGWAFAFLEVVHLGVEARAHKRNSGQRLVGYSPDL